jgi:hypothetical protein
MKTMRFNIDALSVTACQRWFINEAIRQKTGVTGIKKRAKRNLKNIGMRQSPLTHPK